jgi:2-methylcitrate dehydratase
MSSAISNARPKPDRVLVDIADYVLAYVVKSREAYDTARLCLTDSLGCALEALEYPACTKLLGPSSPAPPRLRRQVPGTQFQLDPVQAAFNIGTLIRWLDFNDTWLARNGGTLPTTWGPSSPPPIGSHAAPSRGESAAHDAGRADRHDQGVRDPGVIALEKQLQPRRARSRGARQSGSTAVVAAMLGLSRDAIVNAVSHALSMDRACALIAKLPTPARASRGRRAMPRAAPCA